MAKEVIAKKMLIIFTQILWCTVLSQFIENKIDAILYPTMWKEMMCRALYITHLQCTMHYNVFTTWKMASKYKSVCEPYFNCILNVLLGRCMAGIFTLNEMSVQNNAPCTHTFTP